MKIFIDARMILPGGTRTYAACLLRALLDLDADANDYIVLYAPGQEQVMRDGVVNLVAPGGNPYYWIWWDRFALPALVRESGADLFHSLRRPGGVRNGVKSVITVHSAYLYAHPELRSRSEKLYWHRAYTRAIRTADGLLAVSATDRDELIRVLHLAPSKVFLHLLAAPGSIGRVEDTAERKRTLETIGILPPYFLFIGSYYRFKNIPFMIRSFSRFRRETGSRHRLVLVGQPGSGSADIRRAIKESGVAEHIIETGLVADRHVLSCLYSGAEAFLFATLYDSFGFPVLEAMECGTPVVVSTAGALPEVAGDAALTCGPDDIHEMCRCLERLVSETDLRRQLVERGLRRVNDFSWERCARQTVGTYESILSGQDAS